MAYDFGHWSDHWGGPEQGSWTMGVVLLETVGVGLLSCVCAIFDQHLSIGNVHVTGEPEVARQPRGMTLRSMRIKIINRPKEKMWSLSRYSGDQLKQLMISNKRSSCGKLVQLLRYNAIMSENQINVCPILVLSWNSIGLQVAMTTGTNPKLRVAHELECQVVRSAGAADETEWKQQRCIRVARRKRNSKN